MSDNPSIISYTTNLADQEAVAPLPASDYVGTIEKAENKKSEKGNGYLALTVNIPAEQFPADYDAQGQDDGVNLVFRGLSTEDAARPRYRMRMFLESVGMVPSNEIDINDLIGRTVNVTVGHSTYEGETRAEIKRIVGQG
mgnify:CR=1 FL=1